ncbi:MAG: ABC transporter substrate-binding protein, partial [Cytophagia bacterium]|nr:ABC transporter substrate-binding protein [Cytophagia bacterium]
GFIQELASKYPVWMSDITTLNDALDMIECIGELTRREKEAEGIVVDILSEFSELEEPTETKTAVYLIWKNPFMAVGQETFISEMLIKSGFESLIKEARYPEIALEELKELSPQVLLLSSEPFPFKEEHVLDFKAKLPDTDVKIVDGEMFSWYGSRLKKSPAYFKSFSSRL